MLSLYFKQTESASRVTRQHPIANIRIISQDDEKKQGRNWWHRFISFAASQEKYRFGWLAAAITLQGCVLAPLTLFAIISTGNYFVLWIPCILAFAVTEVVNLAALPTRITIPVLFAGMIVDILVVFASFILV